MRLFWLNKGAYLIIFFVSNGIILKVIFFEKQKYYFNWLFFLSFFVFLFSVLPIESSHTALLAFEGGSVEHILWGKFWMYCLGSVFS